MKIFVLSVLSVFFMPMAYGQDVNYHTLTTTATDLNSQTSIRITGLNSPVGEASARNISFDFSSAGKAQIKAYRNSSMGTTLQFLTNDDGDPLGGAPSVRMQISRDGNVGIGTNNPSNRFEVSGSTFNRVAFVTTENAQTGLMVQRNQSNGAFNTAWELYSPVSSTDLRLFNVDDRITFQGNGNVGIGTIDPKGYKLAVNGKIRAHEIKVETANWPDYVFAKDYELPSLAETERHIKEKGHLPDIPSAEEVKAYGIDLGEMNAKLLQKIEELTLHLIEVDKKLNVVLNENMLLKSQINKNIK